MTDNVSDVLLVCMVISVIRLSFQKHIVGAVVCAWVYQLLGRLRLVGGGWREREREREKERERRDIS
jgi:hypothetical protein